ncbi:MAG: hypothetical protein ACREJU_16505 [Nitrospiraceae bacterium]
MKRSRTEQVDKLEGALKQAHGTQVAPRFFSGWSESVMRDVRRVSSRESNLTEVPRLVWRAAAAVVLVSALLVGSVLTWNAGRADADFSAVLAEATVYPTLLTGAP